LWKLPVIFLCENNGFSEFSRMRDQHPVPVAHRAAAYGMPCRGVAGNNLEATAAVLYEVLADVRAGVVPHLVEASTLRVRGHYEGDQQRYRNQGELVAADAGDPLRLARKRLAGLGVRSSEIDKLDQQAADAVADAEQFARESPEPDPERALDYVIKPRPAPGQPVPAQAAPVQVAPGDQMSVSRIIRQARHDALADDPAVFLAGIDVGGGNVFGLTRDLKRKWPERVLDTPIAETAVMGLAIGSAMAGLRPVVDLMYLDFLGVCPDRIMNQAAKLRFMTDGTVTLPLVIRTQFGSGRSSGSQHSQSLEALLAHIPGLTVVMASSGGDTYGLLRSAIADDNPMIFIENRLV
jgi:2-oxoisovalerate dehydrogenase E1 component